MALCPDERRAFVAAEEAAKAEQATKMQRTVACEDGRHQRIAIDLSFDAIMNDKVRY